MSRENYLCDRAASITWRRRSGLSLQETYMIIRSSRIWFAAIALVSVAGCAAGSGGGNGDDVTTPIDARTVDSRPNSPDASSGLPDARITDARVIDGPVSQPDAPLGLPDGGLAGSCTTNADCTVSGECCFGGLMCVPGTPLPPPINCFPS
jgi:hypothetical protein